MMKLEEELPDAMRDSLQSARPDVAALVAGGLERGRREVRRARIARAVGAGAVLAMVGGLAIAIPLGGGAKQAEQQVATTRVEAPPPKAAPPKVRTTPQVLLQLLLEELPEGAKTSKYGAIAHEDWIDAQLRWSTPKGDSRVTIGLVFDDRGKDSGWGPDACDPKYLKGHVPFCEVQPLGDGSRLLLQQADYPDGRKDQLNTTVHSRGSHLQVYLTVSGTSKLAPPPLTIKQLAKIVTSPVWQAKVDKAMAEAAMKRFGDLPTDPEHPDWPKSDEPK